MEIIWRFWLMFQGQFTFHHVLLYCPHVTRSMKYHFTHAWENDKSGIFKYPVKHDLWPQDINCFSPTRSIVLLSMRRDLMTSHVPASYRTIKRRYCSIGWPVTVREIYGFSSRCEGGTCHLSLIYELLPAVLIGFDLTLIAFSHAMKLPNYASPLHPPP